MGYLWIATIILSSCMEIAHELRMFKDAADAGYKVNLMNHVNLEIQFNPNAVKANLISRLILGVNILQVIKNTVDYNKVRPMVLNQLQANECLEEMSKEEQEEYAKKPTGLKSFLISYKRMIRLAKAQNVHFEDDDMDSALANNQRVIDLNGIGTSKKGEHSIKAVTIAEQIKELERLKEELLREKEMTPGKRQKGNIR